MGTAKWHLIDNLVVELKRTGGIEYNDSRSYESSHKNFKDDYKLTSKRTDTAMTETLRKRKERVLWNGQVTSETEGRVRVNGHITSNLEADSVNKFNSIRIQAVQKDGGFLVKSGVSLKIMELISAVKKTYNFKRGVYYDTFETNKLDEIVQFLGEDGLQSMVHLIKELMQDTGSTIAKGMETSIQFPASAYVSGYNVPTLNNMITKRNDIYIAKSIYRISQRIVAKRKFYRWNEPRLDIVMDEGSASEGVDCPEGYMVIWFAKVLAFMRIKSEIEGSSMFSEEEHVFVQFYKVIGSNDVRVDGIDSSLNCIRLKWQRTEGEEGTLSCSKQFGLIPIDSVGGLVHIVRADAAMSLISDTVARKKEMADVGGGESGWPSEMFYVNRFYRPKGDIYCYAGGDKE